MSDDRNDTEDAFTGMTETEIQCWRYGHEWADEECTWCGIRTQPSD